MAQQNNITASVCQYYYDKHACTLQRKKDYGTPLDSYSLFTHITEQRHFNIHYSNEFFCTMTRRDDDENHRVSQKKQPRCSFERSEVDRPAPRLQELNFHPGIETNRRLIRPGLHDRILFLLPLKERIKNARQLGSWN